MSKYITSVDLILIETNQLIILSLENYKIKKALL